MSISGLRRHSGSSCGVFSGLIISKFRASGDTLVPAVGYCLVFLSVNAGRQGTLWLQLSGIVWSVLYVNFGPQGTLAPAVGYCLICVAVNLGWQVTLWLQLSGIV